MPPSHISMAELHSAERRDSGTIQTPPIHVHFEQYSTNCVETPSWLSESFEGLEDDSLPKASFDNLSGFSNETQEADLPAELLNNFVMLNTLGDGATAKVRKAVHILSGMRVAVKVCH